MAWPLIALQVGIVLLGAGVNYYHAKKREKELADAEKDRSIGGIDSPRVTESAPIPVLFGTMRLTSPAVIWSGGFKANSIFASVEGQRQSRTVYSLNCILAYCAGPIDSVRQIEVDDILADGTLRDLTSGPVSVQWGYSSSGALTGYAEGSLSRARYDGLFGGFDGEGGVNSVFRLNPGHPDQPVDPYSATLFGDSGGGPRATAYRGVFTIVQGLADGFSTMHGTAPRVRPWQVTATRILTRSFGDAQWYSAKAAIGIDMNPAHIIRELYTDGRFGVGLHEDDIDDAAFTAAADTLHEEGFGLSLLWDQSVEARAYIREIERHIDGIVYEDHTTGKVSIQLIRDDYDADELPVFGPSEIIECDITKQRLFERPTMIHVLYQDREARRESAIAIHDPGGIQERGEIPVAVQYPGIKTAALANAVAARDLRQLSAPVYSVALTVTSEVGEGLFPGDLFVLAWPMAGIESAVMRVRKVSLGTPASGEVSIEAMGDVFSSVETIYTTPAPTDWEDPIVVPEDSATDFTIFEMPLLLRAIHEGVNPDRTPPSWQALCSDEKGRACLGISQPSLGHSSYEMWVDTDGQDPTPVERVTQWADKIEADEAIGPDDVYLDIVGTVEVNDLLLHDATGEIMRVTAFVSSSSTMTVERGLFDTTPAYITSSQEFYVIGSYIDQAGEAMPVFARRFGIDAARSTSFSVPREIELRALTATGRGQLEYDDATGRTVDLLYRVKRPYPPGKVAVTQFFGSFPTDDYVRVTWEHRDRLIRPFPQQTDDDLLFPEAQVRYLLDIYEEAPTPRLLRQEIFSNAAVKFFEYTYFMEDADRGGAGAADVLRFELWAERDEGKTPDISDLSYYAQVRRIDRT
jgi:hypothetical protein